MHNNKWSSWSARIWTLGQPGKSTPMSFFFLFFSFAMFFFSFRRCLAHVVQLGNVAIMDHLTKLSSVATTQVIWEFNPQHPDNRVLKDAIDVISSLRTLTIKVSLYCFHTILISLYCSRCSIWVKGSNTSTNYRPTLVSNNHSRSLFQAMSAGERLMACLIELTSCVR